MNSGATVSKNENKDFFASGIVPDRTGKHKNIGFPSNRDVCFINQAKDVYIIKRHDDGTGVRLQAERIGGPHK